jgi:hypothetical protein
LAINHAADVLGQHLGNRRGITRRLDDDVIIRRQGSPKRRQVNARHADPANRSTFVPLTATASAKTRWMSNPTALIRLLLVDRVNWELAGNTATTDPRSQRIRASRRGGHLKARARSPWFEVGLPALACSRCPTSRMVTPYSRTRGFGRTSDADSIIPDKGKDERFNRTVLDEFYWVAFRKKIYRGVDECRPISMPG